MSHRLVGLLLLPAREECFRRFHRSALIRLFRLFLPIPRQRKIWLTQCRLCFVIGGYFQRDYVGIGY